MQDGSSSDAGVREGDVLAGKYRVERVLGVGGVGVVVAAHHIQLDEKVALKFLLPDALSNAEAVARFAREARAAVKIKSEHVARVIDVGTLPNGAPYMVMEYLEGEDLAAWLEQRGPLPTEQAVEFVLQACIAVADAHVLGIVHRDLKPANLFCIRRSDGQLSIKVLDFGISKMVDAGGPAPGSMTRTSALMGSPVYMSPEQMRSSKDVDAQTDIWALGMILFELMTGRPAFLADTVMELAIKVATEPLPAMRGFRPDVPGGLENIVSKCLEKERRHRYRDVAELALALLPFAPKRANASVERISGIIQGAGSSGSALAAVPSSRPSLVGADTQALAGTMPALGHTTVGSVRRKISILGGGMGAAVLVAIVGSIVFWKTGSAQRDDLQAEASVSAIPNSAAQAVAGDIPKLPDTKAPAADLEDIPRASSPLTPAPAAPPESAAAKKKLPAGPVPRTPFVPPSALKAAAPAPCKLVKTVDKNGEPHFSCPCALCR